LIEQAVAQRQEAARVGINPYVVGSFAIVVGLAVLANRLAEWGNIPFGRAVLEYPLWAVLVGLLGNLGLRAIGLWEKASDTFRTELFLKTGLVLMGASVNFTAIVSIGAKGIVQGVVMIASVFFFSWYVTRLFGLEKKLGALIATSVSVCGVSAAIAAAGAVVAKKEQLAYVTTLVILFALPLMVIQPIAAQMLGLSPEVAGAWIGGNIDTTAAVVGAGAVHSDAAMKVASIVKMSQNALIGVVAFLLALYWVVAVEKKPNQRPNPVEIWRRFPKFVLGFALVSLVASIGLLDKLEVQALTNLRNWFLTMAFVSIGLQLAFGEVRRLGGRPVLVYFIATVFNTALALAVSWALFGGMINI